MNRLIVLEKRLRLLKESFDAGVIDAEEYRRNKEKIEKEIETTKQPEVAEVPVVPEEAQNVSEPPEPQPRTLEDPEQEIAAVESLSTKLPSEEAPSEPQQESQPREADIQEETTLESEDNLSDALGEEKPEFQEPTPEEEVSKIIGESAESFADPSSGQESAAEKDTDEGAKHKHEGSILAEESGSTDTGDEEAKAAPIPAHKSKRHTKDDHTLRTVLWIVGAIIVLGLLVFFSINLGQMYPNETAHEKEEQKPIIACYQHADCAMPLLESKCVNGGKPDAMCRYQNATTLKLTIVGDGECSLCSSARMKNILMSWFPGAEVKYVSSSSTEGRSLRSTHALEMLPSYVLDDAIENTLLFSDVKSALRISGNSYVVKDGASGAPFFLNRNGIAGQIDVFIAPSDESSKRAILNLDGFSESFGNQAILNYRIVKDSNSSKTAACVVKLAPQKATEYLLCDAKSDDDCVATLGLGAAAINACVETDSSDLIAANTRMQNSLGLQVPSFLINNRMKVGGVQAADMLREQFCSMNDASACSKELKKSLV